MILKLTFSKSIANTRSMIFPFILGTFFIPLRTNGQNTVFGTQVKGDLNLLLEALIFVGFIVLALQNYKTHTKLGRSIISVPFVYIFFGFLVLILARTLLVLYEFQVYMVMPMVISIYWHVLIYLTMIAFLVAIQKLADRTKEKKLKPLSSIDLIFFSVVVGVSTFVFLTPEGFGTYLMMQIMKTVIPRWGLLHFISFLFTGILTYRMLTVLKNTRTTSSGKYLKAITYPFLAFLVITTFNHLILLLTESWRIIHVNENLLNITEQSLWVIGFIFMIYGFYRLQLIIDQNISLHQVDEQPLTDNSIVIRIMDILTKHIGSMAGSIIQKSSQDIGIDLLELDQVKIHEFAESVQKNTSMLIGDFPSRYLSSSIKKIASD